MASPKPAVLLDFKRFCYAALQTVAQLRTSKACQNVQIHLRPRPSPARVSYVLRYPDPAFGIRIGKSRKTWIVLKGKNRDKVTIGHYPALSLQEARIKALVALGSPYAPSQAPTFIEARADFLEAQEKRLRPYSFYQAKRNLTRHFDWQKAIDKITHNDVAFALDEIGAPSQRAHAQKDVTTFFNWCVPALSPSFAVSGVEETAAESA